MTVPRRLLHSRNSTRLVDSATTRLVDSATTRRIEQRAGAALPAHALLQRAGHALARLARATAPHARTAWIAAGPGNNGGDGLVLARLLHEAGMAVQVSLVGHRPGRALPPDAAWALQAARDAGVTISETLPDDAALAGLDLGVDALLGVGQKRAPEGAIAAAIAALNKLRSRGAAVLCVDVPTGLDADTGAPLGDAVVQATHTLTLLTAKAGLVTGSGREVAGELWFDDLGVALTDADTPVASLAAPDVVRPLYPPRRHLANKGSFGDVHVAGGAAGMIGASLLAGHAASIAGAGRVLVHAHSSDAGGMLPVDVRHPELMLRPVAELQRAVRDNARATVIAGCGGGDDVRAELPGCLSNACRLVLDADALNAIAGDAGLRAQLRHRGERGLPTILTPHPLEAARLLGITTAQVQSNRLDAARRLAADTGAVVVLKGSGTLVATPTGELAINPTGDARLATAGTGDVLAGWIGGTWAAQPHPHAAGATAERPDEPARREAFALAYRTAVAGVFVHGLACEAAAGERLPLVASDLIGAIARATQTLLD